MEQLRAQLSTATCLFKQAKQDHHAHYLLAVVVRHQHALILVLPAANREKFAEAAASAPESFSSLQMATYIKATQFKQQVGGCSRGCSAT
jgi:hypothetical protein